MHVFTGTVAARQSERRTNGYEIRPLGRLESQLPTQCIPVETDCRKQNLVAVSTTAHSYASAAHGVALTSTRAR